MNHLTNHRMVLIVSVIRTTVIVIVTAADTIIPLVNLHPAIVVLVLLVALQLPAHLRLLLSPHQEDMSRMLTKYNHIAGQNLRTSGTHSTILYGHSCTSTACPLPLPCLILSSVLSSSSRTFN
jgi:hypothetical protein